MLANPTLAAFLLFIGMVGLYVEFTHPGMIAPGLIGGICLLLFAAGERRCCRSTGSACRSWWSHRDVPSGTQVHSYGTLTAGGIACLVVGSLILFKTPRRWATSGGARVIVAIGGSAAVIMAALTSLVVRAWRRKPSTGTAGLVAEEGNRPHRHRARGRGGYGGRSRVTPVLSWRF